MSTRNGQDPDKVKADNVDVVDYLNTPASEPRATGRLRYTDATHTATIAGKLRSPAKVRRDVTKAVRAPDLLDVEHYHTRGRFDARAYVRVDAGAVNVFRRRTDTPGQTAAVSLLLDLSGSMSGERAEAAACLALHLGDALKAAAVPFEIAGFIRARGEGAAHGLVMAKDFRTTWTDARDAVGALSAAATGGTAMMPGIKAMAARLRARAGVSRRILLVLTDGQDGFSAGSNKAAIKAADAMGVEVIGLGMFYDASHVFGASRHVLVSSLADVSAKGLSALVDVLHDRRKNNRAA